MNPTIDILMAHKSIRKFTEEPIENDVLCTIVKAGQAAASSSFLQGVTIIRVTDMAKRKQLAAVAGNHNLGLIACNWRQLQAIRPKLCLRQNFWSFALI